MRKLKPLFIIDTRFWLLLYFVVSFWAFSSMAYARGEVVLSKTQYNELSSQLQKQESTLIMLKQRLVMLKLPSTELTKQLDQAENQLKNCRQELTSAKGSLINALTQIEQLKKYLKELEQAIEKERQEAKRIEMQRNIYAGIALILGIALAT